MNSASVSDSRPVREIYDLGDQPPLGVVPEKMHAFCVRQERFGEPKEACSGRSSRFRISGQKMYWSTRWLRGSTTTMSGQP